MRGLLAATAVAAAWLVMAPVALAERPRIVVEHGVTQPVFGYEDAIRERVWVDTGVDSDRDGVDDEIAVDSIELPVVGGERAARRAGLPG